MWPCTKIKNVCVCVCRCSAPDRPCASGSLWDPVNCACVSADAINYSETGEFVRIPQAKSFRLIPVLINFKGVKPLKDTFYGFQIGSARAIHLEIPPSNFAEKRQTLFHAPRAVFMTYDIKYKAGFALTEMLEDGAQRGAAGRKNAATKWTLLSVALGDA